MLRFLRARGAGVSIITGAMLAAVVGAAALCVDVGSIYLRTREIQGLADAAAMAAAADMDRAQNRAERLVAVADAGRAQVAANLGVYKPDPAVAPAARFEAGAGPANAVRVDVRARAPLYFAGVFAPDGAVEFQRSAIAAQARLASFQIGSRLLAVRAGLPNALLSALTGSSVSLSVMDYEALARADIDLFSYVDALRTRLHLEAATFNDVLNTEVAPATALAALADAVRAKEGAGAALPLNDIADAARALRGKVRLERLFAVNPYGAQDHVSDGQERRIAVNALDIAHAVLELANGDRQVALDLGADVPGLADVRIWLAIGERANNSPWLTVARDNSITIRTAQMRLYVDARVGVGGLAGIAAVRAPLVVEAASAQAKLEDMKCAANAARRSVTINAAPSVGMIAVGDIDIEDLADFKRPLDVAPAGILSTPLVKVAGAARVDLGGARWENVTFSGDEILSGAVKRVQTRDLAQATASSLLSNLRLTVSALGLGVNAAALTGALGPALSAAAAPLDQVVNDLSDLLGLHLGEADIRVNGLRCHGVALVG